MVTLARDKFYEIMKDSPNLSYVEEISGFKKSKADVNLLEIMKRLDVFEICYFLIAAGRIKEAKIIKEMYIADAGNGLSMSWEGFDCYLPYDQKRDYVIKQILKGNIPDHPYGPDFISDKDRISQGLTEQLNKC